ncbi:MAG: type I polyketide synthase, partial [Bifidobacteriales bacterium]|nr:type I polyketide synthase [Bifidobacteriales bacterium]
GHSPTLANLGTKTLKLPDFRERHVSVYNLGRDESRVYLTDTDPMAPVEEEPAVPVQDSSPEPAQAQAAAPAPASEPTSAPASAPAVAEDSAPAPAPTAGGPSGADVADLPFKASDAIAVLLAYSTKIRPEQIGQTDTTDTLTNGVSSRRNQLLMDISSELGVASVDGAAEASMTDLSALVNKVAPNYRPFGPVLSDIVRERIRDLFGPSGLKLQQVEQRVSDVWQLGAGWVSATVASLVLDTREGASSRGGDLALLPTEAVSTVPAANALIDQAVQQVAQRHGVTVSMPSAGGAAGGAVVDSAALDAFAAQVTGSEGVLASTARFLLDKLGLKPPVVQPGENEDAAVVAAVDAELGSDWPEQVAPRFEASRAVLFDDRWASAREDLAHIYHEHDDDRSRLSFVGAGREVHDQAVWYAEQARKRGEQDLARVFSGIADQAMTPADSDQTAARFAKDVAVVTGVAPKSIAGSLTAGLLEGGATVIAVC